MEFGKYSQWRIKWKHYHIQLLSWEFFRFVLLNICDEIEFTQKVLVPFFVVHFLFICFVLCHIRKVFQHCVYYLKKVQKHVLLEIQFGNFFFPSNIIFLLFRFVGFFFGWSINFRIKKKKISREMLWKMTAWKLH